MNKETNEIIAIKTEVRERNWEMLAHECQRSGLPVKKWCEQNGIKTSTYYARLRKLREKACREVFPMESPWQTQAISEMKITSGEIVVSLPMDASAETIMTVLKAVKSC